MALFPTKFAAFPRWFRAMAVMLALSPCLGWGSLTWEANQIQLTAKSGDKEAVAVFGFKNTGTTPVTIRDIKTSCSCTVAELSQRTYAPGKGGEIKAILTIGARSGRQEKELTVITDDPYAPSTTLTLQVDIKELFSLSTRMLQWKVGGEPGEQPLEIVALAANRITEIEVKDIIPKERARVRIVPVEPGIKYQLFIQPDAVNKNQTVMLTFVAHFGTGAQQAFTAYALIR